MVIYNFKIKNFFNQKLISYFLDISFKNYIYINYIIFKHLLYILIKNYLFYKSFKYISFFYLLLKFISYKIFFDIIQLITFNNIKNLKFEKFKNFNSIKYKIIDIQKNSKTTKKGRTKKFKIIIVSGNFTGWFGLGIGKHTHFINALELAYLKSLKNIFYINKNLLKNFNNYNIFIKFKASKLFINSQLKKGKGLKSSIYLNYIFELLGCNNLFTKSIGSKNRLNIIYALLKFNVLNWLYYKTILINFKILEISYLTYLYQSLQLLKWKFVLL
uniref:30S ribosomal protein S5 n=1 Tax=Nephromyces sp. ex Molgula occidentalis TaxID=2544991 RepID=A0A5C1H8C4_9APIC|nr:30S ribosomal protein S5 [Nephromyces sp. ex Molgula occidentalis]